MKKTLLCSPLALLLGTVFIQFAQTKHESTWHELPTGITRKLYPETCQDWPESPVPKSLWRGGKKKFPKGKL
jgi:hypothetical protein